MYQTNILEYLENTAPRYPDKVAFSDGVDNITFSELQSRSRSIGSFLLSKGYRRESVVVLMNKHPDTIAAFMGIIYAGCFYVCLDSEMPPRRIEMIFESLKPRAVIYDKKNARNIEKLPASAERYLYDDICESPIDQLALGEVRARQLDTDPIYVVFTSGSTGVPKGVAAAHRSVIDYTETLCEAVQFDHDTVYANQTPLYFDAPLKEIMPTLKLGATTYFVPKQLFMFPTKLCDYLNEHRINTVCWVVSALVMISSLGALESNPPKYLTKICFGSEVFPIKEYKRWREAFPEATFFNLYGPTEATGMSCYWRADRELAEGEPIPIGKPFRNTEIMLIGEDGREVKTGEAGEIYIRGTCVTLGYYRNKEKTDEAFVQNPLCDAYPEIVYRTGDLARYNEHGELVFMTRKDSQIKHMGHRIELGEIEAAALSFDKILQACCVYNDEQKKIVLFYTGGAAEAEIISYMRTLVPRYMLPATAVCLEKMPLTANGKLDRKGMKEKAKELK